MTEFLYFSYSITGMRSTILIGIILVLLIGAGVASYYFFQYALRKRMSSWAKQVMLSDLRAIRAQMNPHFIFNSLNSINRYILKNEPEIASDYLGRFARLMRLVLDNSNHDRISLNTELETMRLYVELEQLRFEHTFLFEIETDPLLDLHKTLIQPLLFQPFLENAIWHGLMHKEGDNRELRLAIRKDDGDLVCEITDNGVGRGKIRSSGQEHLSPKRKSYGINLVRDRLKSLDRNASLDIRDLFDSHGNASGTQVYLRFKRTEDYTL